MASHPESIIDCSKVYVKKSTFSNDENGKFDGAFAAVPLKKGMLGTTGENLGFITYREKEVVFSRLCSS